MTALPNIQDRKQPDRIQLIPFNEFKLGTQPRYLVKGLIPRVGLTVIWGKPKCGKSFWLFDLLIHVVMGWDYRGRRVRQGVVVYCAFEGQSGLQARAQAIRLTRLEGNDEEIPFFIMPVTLNLVRDHNALIAAIRTKLGGQIPVAIALDTLNRSLQGSESSDADMAAYIGAVDAIRTAFECAVPVVHHCGHNEERMRGHSSLPGAMEAEISVKRDAANRIVATVEAMKDGTAGLQIVSDLEVVEVGHDEDGDEITSCVVVPCDEAPTPQAQKKGRPLGPEGLLALEALDAAILDHGKRPSLADLPVGTVVVHADDWRGELYRRGLLDREHTNPSQQFKRLWTKLAAHGRIAQRENLFWRANGLTP